MPCDEPFVVMLAGGHPNSLGRTVEVVACVLADAAQLAQLVQCYTSDDPVVRLRTSSALKRVWWQQPAWVVPYIDTMLGPVADIDQDSTRWTIAQLVLELDAHLSDAQRQRAVGVLQRQLAASNDWIVVMNTLQALALWARRDAALRTWLLPHLTHDAADPRKSVARAAKKLLDALC